MAVPVLLALVDGGFDVAPVVTRQDKKRGRGGAFIPSAVKVAALERGLSVTHRVDDVLIAHEQQPIDLGVVVAFGALIKRPVLELIPMVNLHVSLLPRWRGAAPIERALLAGDDITGVCLMQLEEGLDTGGVIDQRQMPISAETTASMIATQLMADGTEMLLDHLHSGIFAVQPQVGEATYAHKIESHERQIDWNRSAVEISRLIRIGDAWTLFRDRRLKVHVATIETAVLSDLSLNIGTLLIDKDSVRVRCGEGYLNLRSVQTEGRPRVDAVDWARGVRIESGEGFHHG
jgi:methionyl-tRNA formyltransferase